MKSLSTFFDIAIFFLSSLVIGTSFMLIPHFGVSDGHYAFPQIFTVGGASWTSDPSNKAVNCKIKLANNKFI